MKKIAVLSSHTPSLFWFRMDMMKSFQTEGYEVLAVGDQPEKDWVEKFAEHGIRYRNVFVQRNGTNPCKDIQTLKELTKLLKEEKPDKVFSYQAKTVIYGAMAANRVGITEVYPLIAGTGSVFMGATVKTKIVRSFLCLEYRYSMRKCPAVFFQNNDDVKLFRKYGILRKQKIQILHGSGVNTERFASQGLPEQFAILCIARLIRDKGVIEYLEACRLIKEKYPKVHCMLVGPFDTNPSAIFQEDLEPYIEQGIITYYGEQQDVLPYLRQCSVFVLPSYREGTPKTVLEAMSCARAIVTTDAPGCRETVKDGENGFLVPVKDVQAIADCVERLLQKPDLLRQMAAKGREMATELFDVRKVNQCIVETMNL